VGSPSDVKLLEGSPGEGGKEGRGSVEFVPSACHHAHPFQVALSLLAANPGASHLKPASSRLHCIKTVVMLLYNTMSEN
jgi:hypothetical protein